MALVENITLHSFECFDFDTEQFDHEAHVYVAWLYLESFSESEALCRFVTALRRLVRHLGQPSKYHATVTWFYLLMIAERRRATGGEWSVFRDANPDLFSGPGNVLNRYYPQRILNSERARSGFVMPPLPNAEASARAAGNASAGAATSAIRTAIHGTG